MGGRVQAPAVRTTAPRHSRDPVPKAIRLGHRPGSERQQVLRSTQPINPRNPGSRRHPSRLAENRSRGAFVASMLKLTTNKSIHSTRSGAGTSDTSRARPGGTIVRDEISKTTGDEQLCPRPTLGCRFAAVSIQQGLGATPLVAVDPHKHPPRFDPAPIMIPRDDQQTSPYHHSRMSFSGLRP